MKIYKATVSFGDGKPLETTIKARNGLDAQDVGLRSHPGARLIHITGVIAEEASQVPVRDLMYSHPLFGDPLPVVTRPWLPKRSTVNSTKRSNDTAFY